MSTRPSGRLISTTSAHDPSPSAPISTSLKTQATYPPSVRERARNTRPPSHPQPRDGPNVSSAAGIRGVPNRLPYAASKYGVVGITQTMALELGALGVRVNAVVPGMIRTPMTAVMFQDPENVERIRAAHPVGREGQPEEVAAATAFLHSGDPRFI